MNPLTRLALFGGVALVVALTLTLVLQPAPGLITTTPGVVETTAPKVATSTPATSATTSTMPTPTTTTVPTPTTMSVAPETAWTVKVLGPAMVGTGEFVRLSEPDQSDSECQLGWLGYRTDAGIHRYSELGRMGGLKLFNGTKGQDAVVATCEESVEKVLIQGSAIFPESGVPEFQVFDLQDHFLNPYTADLGWRGDSFMGQASVGAWDDLFSFDTGSGEMVGVGDLIGKRYAHLNFGYDFVSPDGWYSSPYPGDESTITLYAGDDTAWVKITALEFAGDPEPLEDSDLLSFYEGTTGVWTPVDDDPLEASTLRARQVGLQDELLWVFRSPEGIHTIKHLSGHVADGHEDLLVESFVATNASNSTTAVTNLAFELVRQHRDH